MLLFHSAALSFPAPFTFLPPFSSSFPSSLPSSSPLLFLPHPLFSSFLIPRHLSHPPLLFVSYHFLTQDFSQFGEWNLLHLSGPGLRKYDILTGDHCWWCARRERDRERENSLLWINRKKWHTNKLNNCKNHWLFFFFDLYKCIFGIIVRFILAPILSFSRKPTALK